MKHRTFRGVIALLLVLCLFVSLGTLTAFAHEYRPLDDDPSGGQAKGGGYDSMVPIGWIKVLKQTYMVDGAEYFARQVAKGVKYRMPAVPEREGDPAVGWRDTVTGEMVEGGARYAIREDTIFEAVYESDLVTVDPNEANMKLDLRQ